MKDKRSVVIRESYVPLFETATDEQVGKLVKAMLKYQKTGEHDIDDPMMSAVFAMIREGIDEDNEAYEETCKRRKDAANKRWGNDTSESDSMQEHASACNSMQEDADMELELDMVSKASKDAGDKKRATCKHKHGEYSNVLLTDDELEKLNAEYGEERTQAAIRLLDEGIAMKGYKYKSHYLAMRKWVFKALEEDAPPGNSPPARARQTYAPFLERKDNNLDDIQRQLARRTISVGG